MPESQREMTLARQCYARYRGAADRSAARPRPLDAPVPLLRRQYPLIMETLAWHYLGCESFRQACRESDWTPRTWRRRILAGESPRFGPPEPSPSLAWSPRSLRRWGRVIENSLRQLRIFPSSARYFSLIEDLANLRGWYEAHKALTPKRDTVHLCRPQQLPDCRGLAVTRLAVVGASDSLEELSRQSGVESRRILRFHVMPEGYLLPICRHGAIHLPRPLLAPGEGVSSALWWNTLGVGQSPATWPILEKLGELHQCPCGLKSWSIQAGVNKQT